MVDEEADPSRWNFERVAAFALFDAEYYAHTYPDVSAAGMDSFEHYLTTGWQEMRNPSERFNTADYLLLHPDVAEAGVNPLVHYAIAGAAEGRATRPRVRKMDKEAAMKAESPAARARHWQAVHDIASPLSSARLQKIFNERCANAAGIVISLSHDQYRSSAGGVQNCIMDEERALAEAGWAYLHLCPARPLPMLANTDSAQPAFSMVLTSNGRRDGVVRLPDLLKALAERPGTEPKPLLVVHHMLGFAVEAVGQLAKACASNRVIMWVHDFFSLCPNPFLLRNDVAFCNAPPAESSGCLVCCYGAERRRHLTQLSDLFEELQPFILAPSQTALDFWKTRGGLTHSGSQVVPHARLTIDENAPVSQRGEGPLRVAHLGAASGHKGWSTFAALLERHIDDTRYQFFRFGLGEAGNRGLTEVPVEVTAANRHAMVSALRDCDIDVVVNWSKCYETFSFTALEAVAGGAYLLAREGAGNVWPAVSGTGRAQAVATETELRALFITGEVAHLAGGRKVLGDLRLGIGSADFLLNGGGVA